MPTLSCKRFVCMPAQSCKLQAYTAQHSIEQCSASTPTWAPVGTFAAMLASASSQGLPFQEPQKQLCQRAAQASLQPSGPVWEQADLDSIPVPPPCNLPDVVVNFVKHNFLGKEVLRHENMQAGVQDACQQKQLKTLITEISAAVTTAFNDKTYKRHWTFQ